MGNTRQRRQSFRNFCGAAFAGTEATGATLALILTWTRSLPLARPWRAFAFSEFLSPLPKRLKSPPGEGTAFVHLWFASGNPGNPVAAFWRILPLPGGRGPG